MKGAFIKGLQRSRPNQSILWPQEIDSSVLTFYLGSLTVASRNPSPVLVCFCVCPLNLTSYRRTVRDQQAAAASHPTAASAHRMQALRRADPSTLWDRWSYPTRPLLQRAGHERTRLTLDGAAAYVARPCPRRSVRRSAAPSLAAHTAPCLPPKLHGTAGCRRRTASRLPSPDGFARARGRCTQLAGKAAVL